jgi:hypothetical protein
MEKTIYTSPTSGTTYEVQKITSWYGDWDTEGNYKKVDVTYWHMLKEGKMVCFSLKEEAIPSDVEYYENPPKDVSSWCD